MKFILYEAPALVQEQQHQLGAPFPFPPAAPPPAFSAQSLYTRLWLEEACAAAPRR